MEIRQAIGGFLRWCAYGCLLVPGAVAIAWLAVAVNSLELFMLAVAMVFAGAAATLILAILIAVDHVSSALRVWWSLRDGEVGPWSGGGRSFLAWLALFAFQVTIAIVVAAIALVFFPEYRAGWP